MSSDNDNMIPPEPLVVKTLKGVVSHTKSSPPLFVGDNDHGDMPVPQYALERELKEARREIKDLRTRLHEIKMGYEGCCHACEPVGAENCRLRKLLNHTPEDILMRNQQLAIEIERLRKERDEARRIAAYQYAKHHNGDEDTLVRNFFQFRGWDFHKEDDK